MMDGWGDAAAWLAIAVIWVGLLQAIVQVTQLVLAARALSRAPPEPDAGALWRRFADAAPAVSVLAPAYNEVATVAQSVRSLLALSYPRSEVIVINDGSYDGTLGALFDAFDLRPADRAISTALPTAPVRGVYVSAADPRLMVIDKENGGKADALNAGLNVSDAPLFCAIDADSILEADALLRAVQPFVEDPERVVATGGSVRVANGCRVDHGRIVTARAPRRLLALLQSVEYVRAFLLARLGWSRLGLLTIISGAFGVFRRSAVVDVGGYARDTVGEDMELIVRLHRRCREQRQPYRIVFVPEPVCWTEAPERLDTLARQRRRWQRGALETCVEHARMLLNPRYGRVGILALGAVLVTDVAGPVAELTGFLLLPLLAATEALSFSYLAAFLALNLVFGVALSLAALAIEDADLRRAGDTRDLALSIGAAIVESFGYRQLNAWWRVQGMVDWALGAKHWGAMPRRGFQV